MHEGLPSVCAPPGVSISLPSGYLLTMASLRGEREGLLQGKERGLKHSRDVLVATCPGELQLHLSSSIHPGPSTPA